MDPHLFYLAGFISGSALEIHADPGSDPCGQTWPTKRKSSVADPYWFQCGSGSSIFCQSWSGSTSRSRGLMTKIYISCWSKIAVYLSQASIKDVQATREVFKGEHLALQNLNFLHFCGSFWPSWIRIPGTLEKGKKCIVFEVLNVLFWGIEFSPVAWTSFMEV